MHWLSTGKVVRELLELPSPTFNTHLESFILYPETNFELLLMTFSQET